MKNLELLDLGINYQKTFYLSKRFHCPTEKYSRRNVVKSSERKVNQNFNAIEEGQYKLKNEPQTIHRAKCERCNDDINFTALKIFNQ